MSKSAAQTNGTMMIPFSFVHFFSPRPNQFYILVSV